MLGLDPFGFQAYIIRSYVELVLEVTNRARWKLCLQEDIDEIRSGNKINEAEQELLEIENYINYASFIVAGGIKNPEQDQVCRWINKAQEAAFCLEDQITMYRIRGFEVGDLIVMKSAIGKKSIKDLISTIKNCIRSKPDKVQQFESNSSKFLEQQLCEISPFVRYSHSETAKTVFGMDNTIKELKKLLRESYNHSVIFVIGEKGSGKTTLVKSLYEDNHVRSSFGPCFWVDDTAKITGLASFLRKVLQVEESVEDNTISELEIMNKVQETFHGEGKGRYLIVLDDVEDTRALHTLKHVLKGCKGKVICLTTRKNIEDDVLQDYTKNESKTIMINPLEESDAHKLLVHVAFPGFHGDEFKKAIEWKDTDKLGDDDLQVTEVAKKITILKQVLVKCMGNPWNIQKAGKLLKTNPSERWDEIQEQINGMLINGNREIGKVDPPIALDDNTLSLSIWRGFLYCLAFPEGLEISAQKLARLWMAEGFVQDSPLHSQEHEAEIQLQVLIRKNLLVEKKKGVDGKVCSNVA
uniref:Uncharacterized protein n=1 Tax=Saccharum hybrid cultivar R570 TaxID=131158 RepID=A0A059Q260_9POAL|nr:hypothetical protein SHCRBa_084_G07_R_10 [Saccharum hybrid cultivar R570]